MKQYSIRQAEQKRQFRVGSTYFFGELGTDTDTVEFEDNPRLYKNVLQFRKKDGTRCHFKWRKMTADEFVQYTLQSKLPMELGKFLVPEVAEYLGFTLDHLKQLKPVAERLDTKHQYEKIIYDSYIQNNGFFLTQEQRDRAFEQYRKGKNYETF